MIRLAKLLVLVAAMLGTARAAESDDPTALLYAQAHNWHAPNVETGQWDARLQVWCEASAEYNARANHGGHGYWMARYTDLFQQLPEYHDFQEIAAESWPGQSANAAAWEQFNSWRQSPGHWSVVQSRGVLYAYAMRSGSNGVYFGIGIIARKRQAN